MATISITTSERQDQAAQFMTTKYNQSLPAGSPTLTTVQVVRMRIDQLLNGWAEQAEEASRASKGAVYTTMTAADKAVVDAVLSKYGA